MKTTVVIPNYNGIKYLENCMNKLELARQKTDFEIVLVDNGSTDKSLEAEWDKLVRRFLTQHEIAFEEAV